MNTLKYKGYIGSVAYSEPDKVFFGKLEGIDDLVNYEGESVSELTAAFQEAVEDYLAFCDDHGVKPEKSYTGTFNVRIAPDTHRHIANLAAEAGISINAFVKQALAAAVENPPVRTGDFVQGFGAEEPEPAMVMEPGVKYDDKCTVKVSVPQKDVQLLKDLAGRMGWAIDNK